MSNMTYQVQEILNRVFDATNNRLVVIPRVPDDQLLLLGSDGDGVLLNRSTVLNANTALANVLLGAPVVQAVPANSLILSNVTANGDIVLAVNNGGNSLEVFRADASALKLYLGWGGMTGDIELDLGSYGGTSQGFVFQRSDTSESVRIKTVGQAATSAIAIEPPAAAGVYIGQVGTDGTPATGPVVVRRVADATAGNTLRDSRTLVLQGARWTGAAHSTVALGVHLTPTATGSDVGDWVWDAGVQTFKVSPAAFGITNTNANGSITLTPGANQPVILAGLNGLDFAPGSDVDTDLLTVTVTGAPRLYWGETQNKFRTSVGFQISGDFVAENNIIFAGDALTIQASNADARYLALQARDTGVGLTNVARLVGAADPYFEATLGVVLIPMAQPGVPVTGRLIYNSGTNKLNFYNGSAWEVVTSA